mmetsp:Transcript_63592/g.76443  ORF Transcript_63592/g.76443 Transcript_63592/m.76443 type:complete len:138 (-) Transcript_63592:58-471(-)
MPSFPPEPPFVNFPFCVFVLLDVTADCLVLGGEPGSGTTTNHRAGIYPCPWCHTTLSESRVWPLPPFSRSNPTHHHPFHQPHRLLTCHPAASPIHTSQTAPSRFYLYQITTPVSVFANTLYFITTTDWRHAAFITSK